MSIEESDQDLFTIICLGNESNKSKPRVKFSNKFLNVDGLKEYLVDKRDSSIIVILSNNISIDILSPVDLPQICAVYDATLLCLYCLPTMNSSVDKYTEQNKTEISYFSYTLLLLLKYWFFIGLAFTIFLAYLFPDVGKTGGYIRSEWSVKRGCIVLVFFINGLSVRTKELAKELLNIRLHLLTQIYSLLITPFLIYGLGLLLIKWSIINKTLIAGIIILGSTSTTISSNSIMTKNAMGNELAALLNAILGNILGIFLSPAIILYFTKTSIFNSLSSTKTVGKQIDYEGIIKELSLLVLTPFILGQIIHALWTKQVTYIRNKFHISELNNFALLAIIWSVFCTSFANEIFKTIGKIDLLLVILINAGIYLGLALIIVIIARLPIRCWQFSKQDTIAIIFCGVMKSLAMGISLINTFFENENEEMTGLLLLPFIIYHVEQLILSAIVVIPLKNWVQKGLKKQTPTKNDDVNIRSKNEENLQMDEAEIINVNNVGSTS